MTPRFLQLVADSILVVDRAAVKEGTGCVQDGGRGPGPETKGQRFSSTTAGP